MADKHHMEVFNHVAEEFDAERRLEAAALNKDLTDSDFLEILVKNHKKARNRK